MIEVIANEHLPFIAVKHEAKIPYAFQYGRNASALAVMIYTLRERGGEVHGT